MGQGRNEGVSAGSACFERKLGRAKSLDDIIEWTRNRSSKQCKSGVRLHRLLASLTPNIHATTFQLLFQPLVFCFLHLAL